MPGYTKLFSSIVHSTIWREPHHVRLVWITMLAISDKNGIVEASVPGLADLSRVTLDECKDALNRMQQPDEYSRSTNHEGRRIGCVDGGWLLLNHAKYRERLKADDERERKRLWWEENRGKGKLDAPSENSTSLEKPSLTDPDPSSTPTSKSSKNIYTPDCETFWKAYDRKIAKTDTYRHWKAADRAGKLPPIADVVAAIKVYLASQRVREGYRLDPERWVKRERWNDEPEKGASGHTVGRPQPEPFKPDPIDHTPTATPEEIAAITGSGGVAAMEAREKEREKLEQLAWDPAGKEGEGK